MSSCTINHPMCEADALSVSNVVSSIEENPHLTCMHDPIQAVMEGMLHTWRHPPFISSSGEHTAMTLYSTTTAPSPYTPTSPLLLLLLTIGWGGCSGLERFDNPLFLNHSTNLPSFHPLLLTPNSTAALPQSSP
jgi:hypothetical protein